MLARKHPKTRRQKPSIRAVRRLPKAVVKELQTGISPLHLQKTRLPALDRLR
jgi:hypothetical protein